ncbi:MAG: hypothetical protein JXR30_01455 [Alphaproteobacteria bacterium]|nr:hypothetical protein [Alphaproteobacteria bacterium]
MNKLYHIHYKIDSLKVAIQEFTAETPYGVVRNLLALSYKIVEIEFLEKGKWQGYDMNECYYKNILQR